MEMTQKKDSFLRYIHNFRGLAILAIVIGHVVPFLNWEINPTLYPFVLTITTNGSTYFVFIAGFLFQFLSKKYEYKSYLVKKFYNVILPYLIVSIPGILLCLWKDKPFEPNSWVANVFSQWYIPEKIIVLYLTGAHFFHFWFIPMIAIYYIFSPIFIWIDRHPKIYAILPLMLILSLIIPRPEDNGIILQTSIHFISIYLLGMFCCHYRERVLSMMEKSWLICTIAALILIAIENFWLYNSNNMIYFLYINTLTKAIISVIAIYFFWRFDSVLTDRFHAIMENLANLSFGIYFVHGYVIYIYGIILKYLGLKTLLLAANPITFLLALSIVILWTIVLLLVIQKILKKRSRYVTGC